MAPKTTIYQRLDRQMSGQLRRYLLARLREGLVAEDIAFRLRTDYPELEVSLNTVRRWLRELADQ